MHVVTHKANIYLILDINMRYIQMSEYFARLYVFLIFYTFVMILTYILAQTMLLIFFSKLEHHVQCR